MKLDGGRIVEDVEILDEADLLPPITFDAKGGLFGTERPNPLDRGGVSQARRAAGVREEECQPPADFDAYRRAWDLDRPEPIDSLVRFAGALR